MIPPYRPAIRSIRPGLGTPPLLVVEHSVLPEDLGVAARRRTVRLRRKTSWRLRVSNVELLAARFRLLRFDGSGYRASPTAAAR